MCVAIWKEKGKPFLEEAVYRQCWNLNDDGGSISWWDEEGDTWHTVKGLMFFADWWKKFEELRESKTITEDHAVFIHFRVGTAAAQHDKALTHPFPVCDNIEDQSHTEFDTKRLIAHNGTIGSGNKARTASDTMLGVINYIEPLWYLIFDEDGEVTNEKLWFILNECLDTAVSRWFIACGPKVHLLGPWEYEETLQTHFSNKDYEDPWEGFGGAYVHAGGGFGTGFITDQVSRHIRTGGIYLYLDTKGDWDWTAWKQVNGTGYTAPEPEKTDILDGSDSGMIMCTVDDDGNLEWADDVLVEEDLLCCPDCASENVYRVSRINLADHGCTECGALFTAVDSDIICYDEDLKTKYVAASCPICKEVRLFDEEGACSMCGAQLDLKEVKADGK